MKAPETPAVEVRAGDAQGGEERPERVGHARRTPQRACPVIAQIARQKSATLVTRTPRARRHGPTRSTSAGPGNRILLMPNLFQRRSELALVAAAASLGLLVLGAGCESTPALADAGVDLQVDLLVPDLTPAPDGPPALAVGEFLDFSADRAAGSPG